MKKRYSMRQGAAAALVAAVLIVGCGNDQDQDPDALLASAKVFFSKNDNNAAMIQLRNALQKDPDLAEARFLLGRALLASGDVRGAEKELRTALELQYPAADVAPHYARSLVLLGDYDKVIGLSKTEVRTAEAKAELMTAVGQAHTALKNPQAAQAAFAAALAAKPGYTAAQLAQARLTASAGNFADAAAMVDSALQTSPGNYEGWQLKGDLLLRLKQLDPALDAFRKAVEAKPDLLPAHMMIVTLLVQQNKPGEAAKQLSALKKIAPKHPQTLYLQALVAALEKNFPEARLAIQENLRLAPDNVRGLLLAGTIETELKAYSQAEAHFQKVLLSQPQHRGARRALITSYMRDRQIGKAIDALTPVLGAIEKDAGMLALAGEVFMVSGDPVRGAQYLAKAAALDPGDARKRTALALSHMATAEPGTAVRELEQAAELDPGIRADLALIVGHMQRREHDKALAAIERLEKKQPGRPLAPHSARRCAVRETRHGRRHGEASSVPWNWTRETFRRLRASPSSI